MVILNDFYLVFLQNFVRTFKLNDLNSAIYLVFWV